MPDLFERTDEVDDLLLAVVRKGGSTKEQGERFYALVADAVQAHRPWAHDLMRAIIASGSQATFKKHVAARCIVQATAKRGKIRKTVDLATVVGVRRDGEWHRMPLFDLRVDELADLVLKRTKSRDKATDRLDPLRRLLTAAQEHASAPSVGEALALAGTTVNDVLAGAA